MTSNIYGIKKSLSKILKFYFVWVIALIWNTFIMFYVSDYLKYDYKISIFIIFIYNMTLIFYLQKKFTFNNKKNSHKQLLHFFILLIALLSVSFIFVPYCKETFHLSSYLSLFIISLIITIINFIVQNYLIFKE